MALVINSPPANARDVRDWGWIPGLGRSPGGEHGNPLQYSCLENPMDTGACRAIVHGVTRSRTRLKRLSMLTFTFYHTRYFANLFIVYCLLPAPTAPLQIFLSILWLCSYLLSLSPSQLECFLFHYNIVKNNILLYKSSHRPLIISKNLSHLIRCYILIRLLMPITNLISCHVFCIIYACWEAILGADYKLNYVSQQFHSRSLPTRNENTSTQTHVYDCSEQRSSS